MSIHELLLAKCEVCCCEDGEARAVLKRLQGKIRQLRARLVPADREPCAGESEAFLQLLRVVGVGRQRQGRSGAHCKHPRLFKMLLKSLNCNSATLDYLCEITAAQLAERSYSLALLEAQLKNVTDRVAAQELTVVKEEPQFSSLRTLPSERELPDAEAVLPPIASQTSLDEPGDFVPAFPFYCHYPLFFGSH